MLVSLTVGKVDAGMAVLLTEDKRIIEFPSILLPSDITSGSIVDITVSRNLTTEAATQKTFTALQSTILSTFGTHSPSAPVLRCRNATQTAVVLEWDPIDLATAEIRSLSLFRNGSKAGNIPRPTELTSTKISGLAVDSEYEFQLVLRTSAGTFSSEKLLVRTHAMTDLTGIIVTPGVMPGALRASLAETLDRIGAKLVDTVRIDTTHFVCTEPRGSAWERARDMNIPVVVPDWIKGCEAEGRIVGVRQYYLDADPRLRQMGPSVVGEQQRPSTPLRTPETKITPPTPEQTKAPEVPPKDTPYRNGGSGIKEESEDEGRATEEGKSTKEDDDSSDEEGAGDDSSVAASAVKSPTSEAIKSPTSEAETEESVSVTRGKQASVEEERDASFQDVAL